MFENIKEKYASAKLVLNNARYKYNYVIVPSVLGGGVLCLFSALILLLINSKVLWIPAMLLVVVLVLGLISLLILIPVVRDKEANEEVERLNEFFSMKLSKNPTNEFIMPRSDNLGIVKLVFDENGYKIDGVQYSYEGFKCSIYTNNYLYHVNLVIVFKKTEVGDKEDGDNPGALEFSLPLDINLLSIMEKYGMKVSNPDVFKFIKENTLVAVKQILKYGKIQKDFYKVK